MPEVKLSAPSGVTCASFAGKEYPVAKDGTVTVPSEAVQVLYGFGFTNAPEAPAKKSKQPQSADQAPASSDATPVAEQTEDVALAGDEPDAATQSGEAA